MTSKPMDLGCPHPPRGWWCSRYPGHLGPCCARPRWWNLAHHTRAAAVYLGLR